jgi:hypothetical protein
MLLDCVAGSRHRFNAQLPICFLGRVSQNAELRGALRSPNDKAAGDTDRSDVVIDDHQAALFIHSRNNAASGRICSPPIR